MVITNLEAVISFDKTSILPETFKEVVKNLDEGIVETFLLQNQKI